MADRLQEIKDKYKYDFHHHFGTSKFHKKIDEDDYDWLISEVERLIKDKELMLKRVQQMHASMTQALDSMLEHDYPDAIYILSQEAGGEDHDQT